MKSLALSFFPLDPSLDSSPNPNISLPFDIDASNTVSIAGDRNFNNLPLSGSKTFFLSKSFTPPSNPFLSPLGSPHKNLCTSSLACNKPNPAPIAPPNTGCLDINPTTAPLAAPLRESGKYFSIASTTDFGSCPFTPPMISPPTSLPTFNKDPIIPNISFCL